MTNNEREALVERLREEADGWDEPKSEDEVDMRGMLHRAADRIKALSAEVEQARMEERAAIVAWLRKDDFLMTADAIEAGEHLK